MSEYLIFRTYFEVLRSRLGDVRKDERGMSELGVQLVILGAALLGTAAIVTILWNKLKAGAEGIDVPAPAAP